MDNSNTDPVIDVVTVRIRGGSGNMIVADRYGPETGEPVLLQHAGGQSRHSWRKVAPRLAAAGYCVYAIDLRGHGESDHAEDGDYRYDRLADDVAAISSYVGKPLTLVGASVGGKAALATAGYRGPEVVSRLVLADAVPKSKEGGISRVAQILLPPGGGFESVEQAADHMARLSDPPHRPDPERLKRNMRQNKDGLWLWHWDTRFFTPEQELGIKPAMAYLETAASRVKTPTLLVRGERSDVVDEAGLEALRALIPHAHTAVIADAGHMVAADQPAAFAETLLAFFASEKTGSLSA